VSVPAESLRKTPVFLLLSTAIPPLPFGDNGQMSLLLHAQAHGPAPLLDRAVSDGVSRSKQLLFNK
jgi:hypothetical protein